MSFSLVFGIVFILGGIFAWIGSESAIHEILAAILNGFGFVLVAIGIIGGEICDVIRKVIPKLEELRINGSVAGLALESLESHLVRLPTIPEERFQAQPPPPPLPILEPEPVLEQPVVPGWQKVDGQWQRVEVGNRELDGLEGASPAP